MVAGKNLDLPPPFFRARSPSPSAVGSLSSLSPAVRTESRSSPPPMEQPNNNSLTAGQESPPFPHYTPHINLDPSSPDTPSLHVPPMLPMPPMLPAYNHSPSLQNMPVHYYPMQPYPSHQSYLPHPGQHPYYAQPLPQYAMAMPSEPRRSRSKKKAAAKGGSSRGTPYTVAEDRALCSAYLNVSQDATVGTNQKSETYWARIANYYNKSKVPCSRNATSLSHRWGSIAKDTSLFCGIKGEVDRLRQSGKTEQDRIDDALQIFEARTGKPFHFLHCWEVLRNVRKWEDWLKTKVNECIPEGTEGDAGDEADSGAAGGAPGSASPDVTVRAAGSPSEGEAEIPRPIGRDAAKKRRSQGGTTSSSSTCLELFEKMAKNREIKQQQALYVQERQLALQEEHTKIAREQWDWTRIKEENQIMLMDLSACSEYAREYFMSLQKEILEKRRSRGGPSGTN